MSSPRRLMLTVFLFTVIGAVLFVGLLIHHGIGDIRQALAAAGWGIAAVVAFHLFPLLADGIAWWALFPRNHHFRIRDAAWMRWVGESVSSLVPATQVGGDIIRARLAASRGVPVTTAAGTVIVDITLSIFTQVLFTLSGVALLVHVTGRATVIGPAIVGSLVAIAVIGGFYALQRYGLFRLIGMLASRLAKASEWSGLADHGHALDCDIAAIYDNRRSILLSALATSSSWLIGAGEVWIALWALGLHATYTNAFILESVGQGVRAAMFLIPGALGVQEGGYVVVGGMLGIPPDTALALALIRRVRELSIGIPGLIAWQLVEGYHLLHWHSPAPTTSPPWTTEPAAQLSSSTSAAISRADD